MDYYGPSATTTYVSFDTSGNSTEPTYIYYQSDDGYISTITYEYPSAPPKNKKEDKLNKDIHNLFRELLV